MPRSTCTFTGPSRRTRTSTPPSSRFLRPVWDASSSLRPFRAWLGWTLTSIRCGTSWRSAVVRRHLAGLTQPMDVLHVYTHNVGLLSVGHIGRQPTVVSLDATNAQNGYRLPQRYPARFTPLTVAVTKPWSGASTAPRHS